MMSYGHYQPLLAQYPLFLALQAKIERSLTGWHGVAAEAIGYRHLEQELPCQDRALVNTKIRPHLLLCDGAGSARMAELGAETLTMGLSRLLITLEPYLTDWLDDEAEPEAVDVNRLAMLLVRHAKGINADLANASRTKGEDYRSTLLLAVMGQRRLFWMQIGDGALAIRERSSADMAWHMLAKPAKGEFANQTCLVDPSLHIAQVKWGWRSAERIEAIVAMSDGATERLMRFSDDHFAPLLDQWADNRIARRGLFECLADGEVWRRTSGDDKSVALLVAPEDGLLKE